MTKLSQRSFMTTLFLVFSFSSTHCTTVSSENRGAAETRHLGAEEKSLLLAIKSKAHNLHQKVANFWLTRGPDKVNGGFIGYHDSNGTPDPKADKGLVGQSRHLWYMSHYYKDIAASPQVKENADSLYRFITSSKLYDPKTGEFLFRVDATGSRIIVDKIQLQANSFTIYGLAHYAMVFDNADARNYALHAFQSIEKRSWDPVYGGFNQKNDPMYVPPATAFTIPGPSPDPNVEKEANTHIQMLQAMSALYLATKDADVKNKLLTLIDVFTDKIIADRSFIHTSYRLDWTPYGEDLIKFGQDFSTVWFLLAAADAVGLPQSDPVRYAKLVEKVRRVGESATEKGFDAKNGGIFESCKIDGSVVSDRKVWWVQTEALNALWRLYRLSGDIKYLRISDNILDFIANHLVTPSGEWVWQVGVDGTADHTYNFLGGEWKTSYHDGRALIQLEQGTRDLLR